MKIYIIFLAFITISFNTHSQIINFDWVYDYGTSDDERLIGVKYDNNLDIICAIEKKVAFSPSLKRMSLIIRKIDSLNNMLWHKEFSTTTMFPNSNCMPKSISIDESNNIYITGSYTDTVNFESIQLVSAGNYDIFIVKFNASGDVMWAQSYGGEGNDLSNSINLFEDKILITGSFTDSILFTNTTLISNGSNDIFISCMDSLGGEIWSIGSGSISDDRASSLFASDNNIYVTGYFHQTANFSGTTITAIGGHDVFIACYSINGSLNWVQQAGGMQSDVGNSVIRIKDRIYLTGSYTSDAFFGSHFVHSPYNTTDLFVTCLDTFGNYEWVKYSTGAGHNSGKYLAKHNNNVFLIGDFWGQIEFNNELLTPSTRDVLICEIDSLGTINFLEHDGGAYGMTLDIKNENIILGGFYNGTTELGNFNLYSNGGEESYIGQLSIEVIGIEENEDVMDISICPNPFSDYFIITSNSGGNNYFSIDIKDVTGNIIYKDKGHLSNYLINTWNLYPGVYFLNITDGKLIGTYKIVKN